MKTMIESEAPSKRRANHDLGAVSIDADTSTKATLPSVELVGPLGSVNRYGKGGAK